MTPNHARVDIKSPVEPVNFFFVCCFGLFIVEAKIIPGREPPFTQKQTKKKGASQSGEGFFSFLVASPGHCPGRATRRNAEEASQDRVQVRSEQHVPTPDDDQVDEGSEELGQSCA